MLFEKKKSSVWREIKIDWKGIFFKQMYIKGPWKDFSGGIFIMNKNEIKSECATFQRQNLFQFQMPRINTNNNSKMKNEIIVTITILASNRVKTVSQPF